jgi:parallel beta-helix repeat protein
MKRSLLWSIAATLLLVLTSPPSVARAETLNCTPITSVPAVIETQGVYCFTQHVATSMSSGIAILINVNNVIIDLNGYKLQGLAAGPGTQAAGIGSTGHRNITIRNGTVRGFIFGIVLLNGGGNVVEDMRIDFNTATGISVTGAGNIIRNNTIVSTGGSSLTANNAPVGISIDGSLHRVINNDVLETLPTGTGFAVGINVGSPGEGLVLENNRLSNSTLPQGEGQSRGIQLGLDVGSVLIVNNRFTRWTIAAICLPGSSGKLRDNVSLASGAYTDCIDAGNNN